MQTSSPSPSSSSFDVCFAWHAWSVDSLLEEEPAVDEEEEQNDFMLAVCNFVDPAEEEQKRKREKEAKRMNQKAFEIEMLWLAEKQKNGPLSEEDWSILNQIVLLKLQNLQQQTHSPNHYNHNHNTTAFNQCKDNECYFYRDTTISTTTQPQHRYPTDMHQQDEDEDPLLTEQELGCHDKEAELAGVPVLETKSFLRQLFQEEVQRHHSHHHQAHRYQPQHPASAPCS
ncbi:hypothetical protein QOT17_016091 [Balamuthia mandrillaris]